MEDFELKGIMMPYKKLIKIGFDFNAFDYMADLIIKDKKGGKDSVFKNAIIIENNAIMINTDKTSVFFLDLRENKNVTVIKIDRSNIN